MLLRFAATLATILIVFGSWTAIGALKADCGDGFVAPMWLTLLLQVTGGGAMLAFGVLTYRAGRKAEREGIWP